MALSAAIDEFRSLLDKLNGDIRNQFTNWLKENLISAEDNDQGKSNSDIILDSIRADIRSELPFNAMAATENIQIPSTSDCHPRTTIHVDAFLYDEDLVDEMCDQGEISRSYCVNCGSQNVKPLTFITHSASVSQIKYMFNYLVPRPCRGTVVDVGSRLGALLYGAYLYTEAPRVIGIELNEVMCLLQKKTVEKYQFTDRIKVIHDNVLHHAELLSTADIIILNNVFEFFLPVEEQKRIWLFLHQVLRRTGSRIITMPSLEDSLSALQLPIDLSTWVRPVPLEAYLASANMALFGSQSSAESDLATVFMYEVL